ncbi:MAG: rhomboid family intramembrane serine protease [Candidatus Pseudobacter hemicellulosilyticus]|uniref:Rhomboid family intramembrane serine protease n=1 Tax=Candidatus Pseudobacter hemicellulosilyticus TaxID=3121375 RepID=A0AAJ6BEW3_9BACT|nr:MAG: rhomboid family intramembrane serine protease [Pseudobacter sp.]
MSITLIIVIITCIVSISAFSNSKIYDDLIFYPPSVTYQRQWYRFFSCGFIHADFLHLAFNMYALYTFGGMVEGRFIALFQEKGKLLYLLMYISALPVCLLPTYSKHKDDASYRSLGASGAVSAVIFAFIMLLPLQQLGLLFIPIYIPGFIFGLLFLAISSYLDKRGGGRINHSAHIWGGLYGIIFLMITGFAFAQRNLLLEMVSQIHRWIDSF